MSSTSSFKVASSTTAFGTLNSTNVNSSLVTTEKLRVSTTETDGPAGLTTKTVKLYAPVEWSTVGATGSTFALSTVKGESQTSIDPAGLAPSVFELPAYAIIDKAQYACKYTTPNSVTVLQMGLSPFNANLVNQGSPLVNALLNEADPVELNSSPGGQGFGLTKINTYTTAGVGSSPAPQLSSSYTTVTIASAGAANTGVVTGETLELYMTYTTPSV
jgi:hypothetical protein